jgi:Domain of unknown function (DUF5666)
VIRTIRQVLVSVALIAAVSLVTAAAWAQPQPQSPPGDRPRPLAGSIASVSDNAFVLTTRDGRSVTVRTTASTRIIGPQPATLADIHTGDRVRILATKAADGKLTAKAVQDIPAALQSATPTRGGVRQGRDDTVMIGGTVMGNPSGGTLTVDSSTGQNTSVAVPSTARVSRLVAVPRTTLAAGARVMVQGTPNADGSVTASTVFMAGAQGK